MDEKSSKSRDSHPAAAAVKRAYTKPKLVEYGNIARLTNNKGNTVIEGGNPKMAPSCL